jgi:hypothetical protein
VISLLFSDKSSTTRSFVALIESSPSPSSHIIIIKSYGYYISHIMSSLGLITCESLLSLSKLRKMANQLYTSFKVTHYRNILYGNNYFFYFIKIFGKNYSKIILYHNYDLSFKKYKNIYLLINALVTKYENKIFCQY